MLDIMKLWNASKVLERPIAGDLAGRPCNGTSDVNLMLHRAEKALIQETTVYQAFQHAQAAVSVNWHVSQLLIPCILCSNNT